MTDVIRGSIWRVYSSQIESMSHTGCRLTRIPNGFMIPALNKTHLKKFKRNSGKEGVRKYGVQKQTSVW